MNHSERNELWARVQDASRWALCGVLALSAAAKLLTPYQELYVVPEPLYYLGAIVELGAAALLHTRYRHHAMVASVLLALAGIALATALPGRLCGCFGSFLQLEAPLTPWCPHSWARSHARASGAMGRGLQGRARSRPPTRRLRKTAGRLTAPRLLENLLTPAALARCSPPGRRGVSQRHSHRSLDNGAHAEEWN